MESDSFVRVAVIGGCFGARHCFHEHPACKVTAVADKVEERRQRLAGYYGCSAVYRSLEEALENSAETFDAVALFTDPPNHADHAIACMKAGKHVLCACPVAFTLQDCRAVLETKQRTGLIYMMAETSYYREECICARELYQRGEFGDLPYAEAEYYHPGYGGRRDSSPRWQGLANWRYGVPPMFYPTHALGLLVGVTGERVVRVSCQGTRTGKDFPERDSNPYHNPFNNEMALGYTDRGHIWRFGVLWNVSALGERGQWLGEKMSCYMKNVSGQPRAVWRGGYGDVETWDVPKYCQSSRLPRPMRHGSSLGNSLPFLAAEFIDTIRQGREPAIDIYESLAMTVPGLIAHESALREGELLEVPDFGHAAKGVEA